MKIKNPWLLALICSFLCLQAFAASIKPTSQIRLSAQNSSMSVGLKLTDVPAKLRSKNGTVKVKLAPLLRGLSKDQKSAVSVSPRTAQIQILNGKIQNEPEVTIELTNPAAFTQSKALSLSIRGSSGVKASKHDINIDVGSITVSGSVVAPRAEAKAYGRLVSGSSSEKRNLLAAKRKLSPREAGIETGAVASATIEIVRVDEDDNVLEVLATTQTDANADWKVNLPDGQLLSSDLRAKVTNHADPSRPLVAPVVDDEIEINTNTTWATERIMNSDIELDEISPEQIDLIVETVDELNPGIVRTREEAFENLDDTAGPVVDSSLEIIDEDDGAISAVDLDSKGGPFHLTFWEIGNRSEYPYVLGHDAGPGDTGAKGGVGVFTQYGGLRVSASDGGMVDLFETPKFEAWAELMIANTDFDGPSHNDFTDLPEFSQQDFRSPDDLSSTNQPAENETLFLPPECVARELLTMAECEAFWRSFDPINNPDHAVANDFVHVDDSNIGAAPEIIDPGIVFAEPEPIVEAPGPIVPPDPNGTNPPECFIPGADLTGIDCSSPPPSNNNGEIVAEEPSPEPIVEAPGPIVPPDPNGTNPPECFIPGADLTGIDCSSPPPPAALRKLLRRGRSVLLAEDGEENNTENSTNNEQPAPVVEEPTLEEPVVVEEPGPIVPPDPNGTNPPECFIPGADLTGIDCSSPPPVEEPIIVEQPPIENPFENNEFFNEQDSYSCDPNNGALFDPSRCMDSVGRFIIPICAVGTPEYDEAACLASTFANENPEVNFNIPPECSDMDPVNNPRFEFECNQRLHNGDFGFNGDDGREFQDGFDGDFGRRRDEQQYFVWAGQQRGHQGGPDTENIKASIGEKGEIIAAVPGWNEVFFTDGRRVILKEEPGSERVYPVGPVEDGKAGVYLGSFSLTAKSFAADTLEEFSREMNVGLAVLVSQDDKTTMADLDNSKYGLIGFGTNYDSSGSIMLLGLKGLVTTSQGHMDVSFNNVEVERYLQSEDSFKTESSVHQEVGAAKYALNKGLLKMQIVDDLRGDGAGFGIFEGYAGNKGNFLSFITGQIHRDPFIRRFGGDAANGADMEQVFGLKLPSSLVNLDGRTGTALAVMMQIPENEITRVLRYADGARVGFDAANINFSNVVREVGHRNSETSPLVYLTEGMPDISVPYTLDESGNLNFNQGDMRATGFVSADENLVILRVNDANSMGLYVIVLDPK